MATDALPASLGEAWRLAATRIDRLDARLLLEHVAGCTHATLIASPERPLAAAAAAQLAALVERRAGGEPLAYLVGSAGFYGLVFQVSPAVLIPRPETELLVELALKHVAELPANVAAPRLLDLGTGSGAIAVSLAARLPQAAVSAVERSPAALAIARGNAVSNGVSVAFHQGDWFAPLAGERFDIVVANPPYVAAGDPHLAQNGLPFEPQEALSDGSDGLACLRAIVAAAPQHLVADAWLLLEHGYDQAAAVRALLNEAGFVEVASHRDLAGIERVSGGRWPNRSPR
ncbi:peptide chain release factor N(5)-glutamine methyltransferase [Rhodocyclus tenuis]|uniref:peptide chain release factor N(5)-glutamine methyltransferase n=1 Tax=Rhodocyclus tenuis TaxID=1066 RepID=UPI00190790B2|nr:peptide chain release factor N(5)-glutamine methyltransferase [Rhodocyclus tenuis]MBK1680620.1 protein-(glutamine-N5) methyltransferase, release factor-specific [Rhodocyclus tenuis]